MDYNAEDNYLFLKGQVAQEPVFSHAAREERYFCFKLSMDRLSNISDVIDVIAEEKNCAQHNLKVGMRVAVRGEIRSYNNKSGVGNRLIIQAFARKLELIDESQDENVVILRGNLCKPSIYRKTPLGREIADVMLAVRRKYGRADYLPCIVWGKNALDVAELPTGAKVYVSGRIQSRTYIKETENGPTSKTAIEISISRLEKDSGTQTVKIDETVEILEIME